jgi:outer membrane protein OmpA-like peptidoglycan-associated protein
VLLGLTFYGMAAITLADPPSSMPPTPNGSLADRLKAVQTGNESAADTLPDWQPIGAADAAASQEIVLAPGLIIVTAANDDYYGDLESIKKIDHVDAKGVHLQYSASVPPNDAPAFAAGQPGSGAKEPLKQSCGRLIDTTDLKGAHSYSERFCRQPEEHFPGSTAVSISTELLTKLRAGEEVSFQYALNNAFKSLANMGRILTGPGALFVNSKTDPNMMACILHRVEAVDLAAPVLLDGQPTVLPALHAACTTAEGQEHFYFLDHPGNPITLAFQGANIGGRLQVVKIQQASPQAVRQVNAAAAAGSETSAEKARKTLEQRLQDHKSVDIYGIYFDFNSATIRPESEAVLQQISAVLHAHTDWKLQVAGHTDNIGDSAFNLGLSQRRAAAVKDALVSRYGIAAERLTTTGFGATRPVDTNSTIAGRARNRRVELQRQ